MRCEKCGSEWKVNNSMEKSITLCPFCKAQLKPQKGTINEVFRWIVDNNGIQIFQQKRIINAYLADLVDEEQKERTRIKLALSSGAGELFYKLWIQSKGQLTEIELNRFLVSIEELGFTKEFSTYVLNVFLYSVSFSPKVNNYTEKKGQAQDNDNIEKQKYLSIFCKLIEKIKQNKEKREQTEYCKENSKKTDESVRTSQKDPLQEELEVRIGERISEGLSNVQLAEFDACKTQAEVAEWLRTNRPDYRIIVEEEHQKIYGISIKNEYFTNDIVTFPLFNSVVNHPKYGNEKEFIHIRIYGEDRWCRSLVLTEGGKYEVDIYIRNDADPTFNTKQKNNKGVALNSKVSVDLPEEIFNYRDGRIVVRIMCDNEKKECVDEVKLKSSNNQNYRLHYITGSSKILNKWKANNSILPTSLFSKEGTLIGLNGLNGVIPGGDEYTIHVRFVFEVQPIVKEKAEKYESDDTSTMSWFKSWFSK